VVIAEKIRKVTENLVIKSDSRELKFTISMGVSQVINNSDVNIAASIHRADEALYNAKESGRNKVCVNDE
jgi:diguanylate cyclase (GGDEF)-like protein